MEIICFLAKISICLLNVPNAASSVVGQHSSYTDPTCIATLVGCAATGRELPTSIKALRDNRGSPNVSTGFPVGRNYKSISGSGGVRSLRPYSVGYVLGISLRF